MNKLYLLGLLSLLWSCNSEDEPCPQYPARYTLDLMRDDFRLAAFYDNVDGELVDSDIDYEEFDRIFTTDEDFQEVKDEFFSQVTLISDTEVEIRFKSDDRDTSLIYPYSVTTAPFYRIDLTNGNEYIVEVAADCSYIEICVYFEVYFFTEDYERWTITDFHHCEGQEASFYKKEENDIFNEYLGLAFMQMTLTYYLV